MDMHLSPAETARRFGVSIKALRLYEQRGLLAPARTTNGATGSAWRVYGPDQIARLHQIIALKRLGLSLAKIGEILGQANALAPVLALQEVVLEREGARLTRALALVRAARTKLGSGQALSIDDLANLTKETVMPAKKALFEEVFARHFTQEERKTIRRNRAAAMDEWLALKPQLLAAMAAGDPTSPAARAVVRRCQALNRKVTGDDGDLRARFQAFRADIAGNPEVSELMAVTPDMADFIKRAASK